MTEFICNIESLVNRIENEIQNKSRKSRTGSDFGFGENSSVDGEIWIKEYLSTIAADIYSKLFSPLARTLNDSFIDGIVQDPAEPEIIYNVVFPDNFDINTVPSITRAIEDTLVSYCVSEWLKDLRMPGWEREEFDHINKYDNLRSLMVRRINPKRSYKLY
jgi:hypothetical protein